MLHASLINDLESSIKARSGDTAALMHKITDLFLLNSGRYSDDQLQVYDEVFEKLVANIEDKARVMLAQRLAPVADAPANTIRTLALDDSIDVAEPILSQSTVLDDETLAKCVATKGQQHLLAIATREVISETVSDQLVVRGDRQVLGALANNQGAKISYHGYGALVKKIAADDWLTECVAMRNDIPEAHFRQLVVKASTVVQQKLKSASPRHADMLRDILPQIEQQPNIAAAEAPKDYWVAQLNIRPLLQSGQLTEAAVNTFAAGKKLEEVIVSIASLAGSAPEDIERLLMSRWSSPVAIILKAIGFHWATAQAIYMARLKPGEIPQSDLATIKTEFLALSRQTAERIMRFYKTRKVAASS